jgi:hypothetical protein
MAVTAVPSGGSPSSQFRGNRWMEADGAVATPVSSPGSLRLRERER